MASGRDTTRVGVRTRSSRTPAVEDIVPNSGWTEDSSAYYLLVDLPEFKKEEVKLQVDSSGHIIVRGERQVNEWKRVRFELTFPVPEDSDMDKIAGKFDGEILYVNVPKRIIAQDKKESEIEKTANGNAERAEENDKAANGNVERAEENECEEPNADNERRDPNQHDQREKEENRNENEQIGGFPEDLIRRWEQEPMLRRAVKVLRKNKAVVITAVIAFSLGFLVSSKFQFSTAP